MSARRIVSDLNQSGNSYCNTQNNTNKSLIKQPMDPLSCLQLDGIVRTFLLLLLITTALSFEPSVLLSFNAAAWPG